MSPLPPLDKFGPQEDCNTHQLPDLALQHWITKVLYPKKSTSTCRGKISQKRPSTSPLQYTAIWHRRSSGLVEAQSLVSRTPTRLNILSTSGDVRGVDNNVHILAFAYTGKTNPVLVAATWGHHKKPPNPCLIWTNKHKSKATRGVLLRAKSMVVASCLVPVVRGGDVSDVPCMGAIKKESTS